MTIPSDLPTVKLSDLQRKTAPFSGTEALPILVGPTLMKIIMSDLVGASWTPILGAEADGSRLVLKVADWTGGGSTSKPATGYIGPSGLVADPADAVDIFSGAESVLQDYVDAAQAAAEDAEAASAKFSTLTTRNGYLFAILSPLHRLLMGLRNDGSLIAKLPFVSGKGSKVTRQPDLSYRIDTRIDDTRKRNGILAAIVSPAGKNIGWWRWDGTLVTKLFLAAGKGTSVSHNVDGSYSLNTPMDTSRNYGGYNRLVKSPAGRILAAFDRRDAPLQTKVQHHEVASFRTNGTISAWIAMDSAGNSTLKTVDASGISHTFSGLSNVSGLEISNNRVVFFATIKGERAYWWSNADGTAIYHANAMRAIACDGDSLTASSGSSSPSTQWPFLLGYRTGVAVINGGIPGTKSQQIAFRAGGYMATAALAGNAIPASGAVALSSWTIHGDTSSFAQPFYPQTDGYTLRCFVTGSDGNLYEGTLSVASGAYSFTRTTPGSSVAVPNPATFTANVQGKDEWIHIIRLGQNDGYDQTQVLPALAAIVANLKSLNKKFLIIGQTGSAADIAGSANYNTLQACNAAMLAAYPNNYARNASGQDLRAWLVSNYNPSLPQDVTDHGNDVIPTSLRSDLIHNNDAGYDLTEQFMATVLAAKGWLQ